MSSLVGPNRVRVVVRVTKSRPDPPARSTLPLAMTLTHDWIGRLDRSIVTAAERVKGSRRPGEPEVLSVRYVVVAQFPRTSDPVG